MRIEIVGPGCPRCQQTERNVVTACSELGLQPEIIHVSDVREFVKYGVRITPAVVIEGKVVVQGKVPSVDELKQLLAGYTGRS
ncbi:MAG: thioredoxin family protein [candidate division KSB1 bacterium]|nr:thioredoxin family protein [candidate division KSB1 bacterium]